MEVFKEALESRTRISAKDVISAPVLGKHEPFDVSNLQVLDDDKDDESGKKKVKEYLGKISEASSHLNYKSRCAIQHSLDECKSQRRMEIKRGKLVLQHLRRDIDVERIRKLASQKDRTGAEIEFLAMFLEACCERDSLLSRFAMRSSSEKQSHMKRIFKSWASHLEVVTSIQMLQQNEIHQDKSTVDQHVFFLVTNGVNGYDDLGFNICSLPRYSIVSNFGSHERGLKQKNLRLEWAKNRTSKKTNPFMLRLHRSRFSASFAEMRHLSHLRTAHSWIHALGWICTSARIQQDAFSLVTNTHHFLNNEDDEHDSEDRMSIPFPCTNDIVRTIWDALRRNEHSSCWKLSIEECRSILRERVGDHAECLVLDSSEVLWHAGHARYAGGNCYVILQGRIDIEI